MSQTNTTKKNTTKSDKPRAMRIRLKTGVKGGEQIGTARGAVLAPVHL